ELLVWCESKMTTLDDQIRGLTDNQDLLAKRGQCLQQAQNAINGLAAQWKDKVDANSDVFDGDKTKCGDDAFYVQHLYETVQDIREMANAPGCPNPGELRAIADKLE